MHFNLLWGTLSSIINLSSSSTRMLVFYHLIWVTVIDTSLLDVWATVPAKGPGVREGYIPFLDASWIPSELQGGQNIFAACQHTNSEWDIMRP